MFEAFRKLIGEFNEGGKHHSQFEDGDYRLAAAALLLHVAGIDGDISDAERDKIHAVIKQHFKLDDAAAEQQSVDLYRFTAGLNRSLDEPGRIRLVEMMWQIVFADGRMTEFEDNLIWRAADLLGVSQNERIALRERVSGQKDQTA